MSTLLKKAPKSVFANSTSLDNRHRQRVSLHARGLHRVCAGRYVDGVTIGAGQLPFPLEGFGYQRLAEFLAAIGVQRHCQCVFVAASGRECDGDALSFLRAELPGFDGAGYFSAHGAGSLAFVEADFFFAGSQRVH